MSNKTPSSDSELTVVLIGIASMLLVAVLYIGLGFAQNIIPDMSKNRDRDRFVRFPSGRGAGDGSPR